VPGGLAAGDTATVNLTYAFPRAGTFETVVEIDTTNAVNETNEVNNLQIAPVSVLAATVDLVITDFTVSPASPVSGTYPNPVTGRVSHVSITIHNQGNSAAGAFQVDWKPDILGTTLSKQVNGLAENGSTTVEFDYTYGWPATYNSIASVDSTSRVSETNEFNNITTKQVTVDAQLSDLLITNVSFSPSPPIGGSVTTATITIANMGHANAGPFEVKWVPGLFIPPLAQQVNSLAEGATTTVSFDYTFPFSWSYDSVFTVDGTNMVWEMREDNNTYTMQVPVGAATIDLTITSVTVSPASPTQGTPATFFATVKNNGNTPAGKFMVSLNPDTFGLIGPGPTTLTKQVNGLGAGQQTTVSFPFTYTKHGDFRVLTTVDAFNNILETNEANNNFITYPTVQPAPIDLQVTSFSINPSSPTRASTATASITVKNAGPWTADAFAVQWKLKDTDDFGPTVWVNGLFPGQSQTVTIEGVFYEAGTFTSAAVVDVFNTVPEPCAGCEDNNTKTLSVTVQPRKTVVKVNLNSMHVYNDLDDGLAGSGEWNMWLATLDPDASCSAFGQTIDSIRCSGFYFEPDGAGTTSINTSVTVTLVEFTPLVIGIAGFESDDPLSDHGLVPSDNPGFALDFWFPPDYLTLGTFTLSGQEGDGRCDGGKCFDANITVSIISQPPPTANGIMSATTSDASLTPEQQDTMDTFTSTVSSPPIEE
jgi:subtilase family serine protease